MNRFPQINFYFSENTTKLMEALSVILEDVIEAYKKNFKDYSDDIEKIQVEPVYTFMKNKSPEVDPFVAMKLVIKPYHKRGLNFYLVDKGCLNYLVSVSDRVLLISSDIPGELALVKSSSVYSTTVANLISEYWIKKNS